jgi:hypothetical protein
MKVLFKEWECTSITNEEKEEIEGLIKNDLIKDKGKLKHIPTALTVSIFEVRSPTALTGTVVGDNGEELVSFTCSIARGHSRKYSY